ncbi:MAG: type II toxin-antitoxin system VapC family toxin [Chloroflexota bacterium]
MSDYFVDTSALAKRYVVETGSGWVKSWIFPRYGNAIVLSRLATIEIIALLTRKQREVLITASEFLRIRNSISAHLRTQYSIVEFEPTVLARARRLLVRYPLRTLDSIQLASALEAARFFDLTFVSADTRLLTAASAEGLPTDDPNAHP